MALYIQTNLSSLVAQKNLNKAQASLATNFNKLSSGFRINTAADDAAGLAVSEKMKMQIRSMAVAERNANDGISMAQVAEAALGEVTNILSRMRELSTQAASGSLGSVDRSYLNTEFTQLKSEISRIQSSTKFNGVTVIASTGTTGAPTTTSTAFQIGADNSLDNRISMNLNGVCLSATLATVTVLSAGAAQAAMTTLDNSLKSVSEKRATFGAVMNRLDVSVANLQTMRTNLSAANSRIRDVDVAEETAALSRNQVLTQAGAAVLAQANQSPQVAMGLLRG